MMFRTADSPEKIKLIICRCVLRSYTGNGFCVKNGLDMSKGRENGSVEDGRRYGSKKMEEYRNPNPNTEEDRLYNFNDDDA